MCVLTNPSCGLVSGNEVRVHSLLAADAHIIPVVVVALLLVLIRPVVGVGGVVTVGKIRKRPAYRGEIRREAGARKAHRLRSWLKDERSKVKEG